MKWASRVGVFTLGVLMSAVCARPASASPVLRWHGQQQATSPAASVNVEDADDAGIDSFLAVLANPAGFDEASTAYQMTNLNAFEALSVDGLGGVADLTVTELDVVQSVKLALGEMIDNQDAMLLEAQLAQDLITAMTGMPLMGIDSLAAIDTVAGADADSDSLLASLLANDGPTDVTVGEAELAEANEADGADPMYAGVEGSGGAWYGSVIGQMYGAAGGSDGHSYGGDAGGGASGGSGGSKASPHHSHVKHDRIAAEELAAAQAVPLPAGAWAGLILLATLGAAYKVRGNRAMA